MKDRMLTLALAVAAFALFYALFFASHGPQTEPVSRPVSTEQGPNGYLVMQRWLASQHVPLQSFRQRYDKLPSGGQGAADGNLLITTVPHLLPVRSSEQMALRLWVERGNTLLILAGLADTPEWSMGEGYDPAALANLSAISGMDFVQVTGVEPPRDAKMADGPASEVAKGTEQDVEDDAQTSRDRADADSAAAASSTSAAPPAAPPAEPTTSDGAGQRAKSARNLSTVLRNGGRFATPVRHELIPNGTHPLLSGVRSVVALSEYPSEQFHAEADEVSVVLELARDKDADEPVMWLAQMGLGRVIVSGFGSVFTNKLLAQADNAQLLANIVATSLRGGQVIIDDTHQGSVSFYDAQAFFGDPRLHRTLWWLVALWLVFILGPQRLRARPSSWQPVDITSFVRSTGGFLARVVRPSAAAQQLFEHFFRGLRGRDSLPGAEPDWQWLEAHSTVTAADLRQLQDLHRRTLQGRRVDLPRLHNLLTRVRRAIEG